MQKQQKAARYQPKRLQQNPPKVIPGQRMRPTLSFRRALKRAGLLPFGHASNYEYATGQEFFIESIDITTREELAKVG